MKGKNSFGILIVFIIGIAHFHSNNPSYSVSYEILVESLKTENSGLCYLDLVNLLTFRDIPAFLSFYLNSGKYVNDLGDTYSCSKNPKTRHITLSAKNLPYPISLGLCIPKRCNASDINFIVPIYTKYVNSIYPSFTRNPYFRNQTNKDITFVDTVTATINRSENGIQFYLTIIIFSFLFVFTIIGTCIYTKSNPRRKSSLDDAFGKELYPKSYSYIFSQCFNFNKNLNIIFRITGQEDENLQILNGCKTIAIICVIFYCEFFYLNQGALQNVKEYQDVLSRFWTSIFTNSYLAFDVLLYLSSFVSTVVVYRHIKKTKYVFLQLTRIYLHRLIRILPLFFVIFLFYNQLMIQLGEGPIYNYYIYEVDNICKTKWWQNFLFIKNFFSDRYSCMDWTWYISCEVQFFVLIPIISYIVKYNFKIGILLLCAIFGIALGFSIAISYSNQLSLTLTRVPDNFFSQYYQNPLFRLPSYCIGILASLIYQSYKDEENNFFKKFALWINSNSLSRLIIYIVGFVGMFLVVFSIYFLNLSKSVSCFLDPLFVSCSGCLFNILMSFIILPVLFGNLTSLKIIVGNNFFIPLSKITTAFYLLCPVFIKFIFYQERKGISFRLWNTITQMIGFITVSFALAFLFSAFVEIPFVLLEKLFATEKGIRRRTSNLSKKMIMNSDFEAKKLIIEDKKKMIQNFLESDKSKDLKEEANVSINLISSNNEMQNYNLLIKPDQTNN